MAKASDAARVQAAAIRSNSATSSPRRYTQADIDSLQASGSLPYITFGAGTRNTGRRLARAGDLIPTSPRRYTQADIDAHTAANTVPSIQVGGGRQAGRRPARAGDIVQDGGSLTAPTRPTSVRQTGSDIPIFESIPQSLSAPFARSNRSPSTASSDAFLQGRKNKFADVLQPLKDTENSLQLTNLTGNPQDRKTYVVGTQARIAGLRSARSSLQSIESTRSPFDPQGRAERGASSALMQNIERNLKLAQNQRSQVQSVLSSFREKQRQAQRVNAEVQSGRRPRRSAGSVIPNLPGLLSPASRRY